MTEGLGVNTSRIFALVFTLGCMLGTVGGALVVPSGAASLDMAVELVVESFAVVVIGGLGSMRGALVGALVVGLMRAAAISLMPETRDAIGLPGRRPGADLSGQQAYSARRRREQPVYRHCFNPVTRRAAPRPNGLWVMLGLIVMLAAMPLVASPYAPAADVAVCRLQHRAAGLQPVVWQYRASVLWARDVSRCRRIHRGGADVKIRHAEFRTGSHHGCAGIRRYPW